MQKDAIMGAVDTAGWMREPFRSSDKILLCIFHSSHLTLVLTTCHMLLRYPDYSPIWRPTKDSLTAWKLDQHQKTANISITAKSRDGRFFSTGGEI